MKVIVSWSGGKDSCLALHEALAAGHEIKCLLNFVSAQFNRCCFHGLSSELIRAQANALGIPIVQKPVPPEMPAYESAFKEAVSALKEEHGIAGMVFGDIYLDEHRLWVERVCADLKLQPIEPLWNRPVDAIIRRFLDLGFAAIVVSARADFFSEDILGREIDRQWIDDLKGKNVCPCGENGEFHTFVTGGPLFHRKIGIRERGRLLREGYWPHWFLEIEEISNE